MTREFLTYAVICIFVNGAATFLTRLAPFALFSGKRKMPERLKQMANVLPSAIIAVLVIYGISPQLATLSTDTISAVVALALTVLVHLWRSNTLLSMFVGTGTYMLLIHIFA